MDASVIAAMVAAVDRDPGNPALRLHLAGLLGKAERWEEALDNCKVALEHQPDLTEALELAAEAARRLGQDAKADSYQRLHALMLKQAGVTVAEPLAEEGPEPDEAVPTEPAEGGEPSMSKVVKLQLVQGGMSNPAWQEETKQVRLDDVAGMEDVKRRLHLAFLGPLKNPDMMKLYGKQLRGGLLLYGPPGCGKTYIARATAGELGARFVSVGLEDVLDMYLGQSERNLHSIFENARRTAPTVLFFDEIDALGRKRSLRRESVGRDVVNQLLAEMDSFAGRNQAVFVMAATNHPWDVDTALRRPGRFDRMVLVLPPDRSARKAILESNLSGRLTEGIDTDALAEKTEEFSGADIVHLCESAAETAMEDSLKSGAARPIRQADFRAALRELKPSSRPWFETARNYALFANEGGVYDDLLTYLRSRRFV